MAAQYERISLETMHAVLTTRGFVKIDVENTFEYVYQKRIVYNANNEYYVRIYTSIDKRTNCSRNAGSDAIRIVVLNATGDWINGDQRVNRSTGWAIRLNARIDNWTIGIMWCPQCSNTLRIKTGKYGLFYGCSSYPKCGYTQPIKKVR